MQNEDLTLSFREFLEISQSLAIKSYSLETILLTHEKIVYEIFSALREKKIFMFFEPFLSVGVYLFYTV